MEINDSGAIVAGGASGLGEATVRRLHSGGANAVDDTRARAEPIVADAIREAKRKYAALGDSPGDPPYVAQAPAIDVLEKRVRDEATTNKW